MNRRARALRLSHHAYDLRQHRVLDNAFSPHKKTPGSIDGGARHLVAGGFLDRHGLAGQHRLVDDGAALDHHTIHGHLLARPDAEREPRLDLVNSHVFLAAVAVDDPRRLRRQAK